MARNYKIRIRILFNYFSDRPGPVIQVGIGNVAQPLVFGAFYQTAAIQNSFFLKPNYQIIGGVALAGVIRFKLPVSDSKYRIFQ